MEKIIEFCEECSCKIKDDVKAVRDGSHLICATCCKIQDIHLLMCDYLHCEGDSMQGKKVKKYLKDKLKQE